MPASRRNVILAGLTLLLAAGAIPGVWERDVRARGCDRSNPFQREGCYGLESRSMAAASHYLRDHAPPDALVLTVSGAAVNYLSGRLTASASIVKRFPPGSAAAGLKNLGINYILITGHRQFEKRRLGPWLLDSCRDFRVEAQFPPGGFILMPEAPRFPAEEACSPLAALVRSRSEASDARPEPESQ